MLIWYNHLSSLLPETSGRWRGVCLGEKILAGNFIIRESSVFTYTESTFRNMWAVLVSTISWISCGDDLPGIWLIKFWVPLLIMPRVPITTGIVLVLIFHIFEPQFQDLYIQKGSLRELFLSDGTVTSSIMHVFSSKFFIVMSAQFASIFLSVLIVKPHRIVISVLSVTGCGICSYHFCVWSRLKFLHNFQ